VRRRDPHDGRRRSRRRGRDSSGGCDGCDVCDLFHVSLLFRVVALRAPTRPALGRPSVPARVGLAAIHGYRRLLAPRLAIECPHEPSCSGYGLGAVRRYGLWQGSRLIAGRLRRCDGSVPRGTADPVP